MSEQATAVDRVGNSSGSGGGAGGSSEALQNNLRAELTRLRAEWEGVTSMRLGGGPYNTEGLRMMLVNQIRMLEVLTDGKATTQLTSRHHA